MQYMAETGIGTEVIKNVVRELRVRHYSSTEDDYNVNFQHEQVWIFGITKNLVDDTDKYKNEERSIANEKYEMFRMWK